MAMNNYCILIDAHSEKWKLLGYCTSIDDARFMGTLFKTVSHLLLSMYFCFFIMLKKNRMESDCREKDGYDN